jgi:[ribosomal protein S5]-alanine N-acetyltransferase
MIHERQAPAAGHGQEAPAPSADQPDGSGLVTLRPATSGDEAEFLDLVHASARLHHPWMSLPATPEDFQAYIRRYEQR